MINWLIEASLRNRLLVIALFLLVGGWGYWALLTTPIDAIPDLSDNQVIVFTDWPGRSPQEVEDQITYPLTVSLQGLAGVRVVRSSSAFGFSMINVIFEDRGRSLLRPLARAGAPQPAHAIASSRRRPDARPRRHRCRPRVLVHGGGPGVLAPGPPVHPGLVRPLPAQLRARRGRGGQRRGDSAPVPDRRRPEPSARLPHPPLGGGGRRDAEQPQRGRQRRRRQRDVVRRARPRAHRGPAGHRADRSGPTTVFPSSCARWPR
jgi:hypothetical protein